MHIIPPNYGSLAADFDAAADLLLQCGWCQGEYYEAPDGALTVEGAVLEAATGHSTPNATEPTPQAVRVLADLVAPGAPVDEGPLAVLSSWNDVDGRTLGDVLAVLRRAAANTRCQPARSSAPTLGRAA